MSILDTTTWEAGVATGPRPLRGVVHVALLHRSLASHVPDPVRVLDITGTSEHVWSLARLGAEITVVGPDPETFEHARARLTAEDPLVSERLHLVENDDALGTSAARWPLVCCNGLPHQADQIRAVLTKAVEAVEPGGLVSVVTENPAAVPLRPALDGRWSDAVALLDATSQCDDAGSPGVTDLIRELGALAAPVQEWYGIGFATNHLRYTRADRPGHVLAFDLEWELSRRDPYRSCGHLLHLIGRRDPLPELLP